VLCGQARAMPHAPLHRSMRAAGPAKCHLPSLLHARQAALLSTLNTAQLTSGDATTLYDVTRAIRHRVSRQIIMPRSIPSQHVGSRFGRQPFKLMWDLEVVALHPVALRAMHELRRLRPSFFDEVVIVKAPPYLNRKKRAGLASEGNDLAGSRVDQILHCDWLREAAVLFMQVQSDQVARGPPRPTRRYRSLACFRGS
jgi:hypothetical protein